MDTHQPALAVTAAYRPHSSLTEIERASCSRRLALTIAGDPAALYALNELPQPHVDFTFGLLNLKPEPSIDST